MCQYYIGTIPVDKPLEEQAVHEKYKIISKITKEVVKKGKEDKGLVYICFGGRLPPAADVNETYKDIQLMEQLRSLIEIKLREIIREDKSGTYGVGVYGGIDGYPERNFQIQIEFGCEPAREEELIAEIIKALDNLKKEAPAQSDVDKLRETYRRNFEVNQMNGSWWLDMLANIEVFKDMPALTSIEMLESVTAIGESAFEGCTGLTSIKLPEGLTCIKSNTFKGCSGLTSLEIPKSVTTIGLDAFSSCRGLTSIEVPEGVTSIEPGAFHSCSGLKSITLPLTLTYIGKSTFAGCESLTSINLPEGIDTIRLSSYWSCSALNEVHFPASLKFIERNSFRGCTSLEHVYCLASKVPDATQPRVFLESSYQQATLHVPSASVNLYKKTEPWNGFKSIVPIEEETDAIMVQKSEPDTHLLFDLQGRPVKDAPKHGIYVKDGRKVIW